MQVYITAKYQNNEEISDCLDTISKAVEIWEEKYSILCEYDGRCDGVELHIEPIGKTENLNSEYEIDKFISLISDRLKSRSVSHLRNPQ